MSSPQIYPTTADEPSVDADRLLLVVTSIFAGCGMASADASLLADSLVAADLGGVHSHGVLRVPEYVVNLTTGGVNPRGRPRIVREFGGCLLVDGDNSMGQIGAHFAMRQVIERAQTTGIAAAAIRGSNHCGAMAYFASMALPHDMIGIATTNALPTMAPWGGAERILGINPIGIAMPAGEELPLIYDAAFSGSSLGKIRVYQQKGLPLPAGWALDRQGVPTTDPAVAIDGLLAPIGGFKGAGLAMMMGILASMLSGAAYGTELGSLETGATAGQDGHFVAALSIAAFEDTDRFKARVDGAVRQIHECRLAPGFDRIYAPGELEQMSRQRSVRQGIRLNQVTFADLTAAARRAGVSETDIAALLISG